MRTMSRTANPVEVWVLEESRVLKKSRGWMETAICGAVTSSTRSISQMCSTVASVQLDKLNTEMLVRYRHSVAATGCWQLAPPTPAPVTCSASRSPQSAPICSPSVHHCSTATWPQSRPNPCPGHKPSRACCWALFPHECRVCRIVVLQVPLPLTPAPATSSAEQLSGQCSPNVCTMCSVAALPLATPPHPCCGNVLSRAQCQALSPHVPSRSSLHVSSSLSPVTSSLT